MLCSQGRWFSGYRDLLITGEGNKGTSLVGEESPEKTTNNFLARKNFQPNKVENARSDSLLLCSSRVIGDAIIVSKFLTIPQVF